MLVGPPATDKEPPQTCNEFEPLHNKPAMVSLPILLEHPSPATDGEIQTDKATTSQKYGSVMAYELGPLDN